VTKVFTTLLLAEMAERGEVNLSDPAASYLPEPSGDGPSLADLATHTSGLPPLPRGLLPSALLHPADPYARYPVSRLVRDARRALRAASSAAPVQRPYAYSNFGFGLLGYLLGRAAGVPYETLVTTRICAPLCLPARRSRRPGRSGPPRAIGTTARSATGTSVPWPERAASTRQPPTWPASCAPA
jgi:CubicO group peptidase (beta-lactamase class C family)